MSKPVIELITCESGDWEVLRINYGEDFNYSGHRVPSHVWVSLLEALGYKVDQKKISDGDMEEDY